MLFQTNIRFLAAFVGSLVAFYIAAHLFHAMGFLTTYELQRVGWMYNQFLEPITSLDWKTQKTSLIAIAALAVNALLVGMLFKKWSYKPVKKIDPLARIERKVGSVVASGERLPTHEIAMYTGMNSSDDDTSLSHDAVVKKDDEERRLLGMLGK